jgi:NitT/TauT family transport system substrate-binding protein
MLALAAVATAAQRPRPASALERIRITGLVTEAMCPLYYAMKTGMFERAGLDVTYTPNNSGAAAMAAVVSGDLELGTSNTLSISSAHVRGIPIAVVAPQVLYTTRTHEAMLQVATDSRFQSGADLNGKMIAVPTLAGINALAAKAWVEQHGGVAATLKFVEMPNASQPEAIAQHRIDAAILEPPVLESSIADGTSKTIGDPMGAIATTYAIAAFVAKADWATAHADTVTRFCRALSDSAKYVNTHYAETAPLVAELTKIDLPIAAKMARTTSGTRLNAADFQPLIDAAAKYGFIAHPFPARELFWSGAA